ncbi:YscQ/HrcQ family type III secretion apparatus protein [Burkholderia pyrrocinia]|uniref:YscQ/HrcQ family type III secretion apparatus protein n=1 Tax=Burkholderia pyrrocinia TaxID=60550 RepID=A0A2Z5NAJ8_BURPY|nr:type III secretion system cytoplasmic ring protein SctQ [Burkholderia pyrrocinia]AXF25794.1 YscQ/HrcQ family type III secretion apparatus protein [Burkholderia pyrrocinia]
MTRSPCSRMNHEPNRPNPLPLAPLAAALARIAPSAARLARALSDARLVRAARRTGLDIAVRAARTSRALGCPASLTLRFDAGTLRLRIDAHADAALAFVVTDTDATRRAAAAGIVLERTLARLAPLGLGPARVVEFAAFDADRSGNTPASLDVMLISRASRVDARVVSVDDDVAAQLEAHCTTLPAAPPPWLHALRVPTRVRLGTRRYDCALLRSLRAGDILLHALAATPDGVLEHASLHGGHAHGRQWRAAVRVSGPTLILTASPAMTSDHDDAPTGAFPLHETVPVDTLDVPVQLELDAIVLPVADLAALGPGHILELALPVDDADIRLVVYGQTIGVGRLVAVGDQLGVQISRMAVRDATDS